MNSSALGRWWREEPIATLMEVLDAPLGSARFVGGCVRNTIMGIPITDVDIATKHLPSETIKLLKLAGIKYKTIGLSHGTVTAFIKNKKFEITTLRRDVETYGRHAKVEYTDCWHQDAMRRDFTMNALFMSSAGEIFDPLGFKSDVIEGYVRFVGIPSERLNEDFLRVLRFFRFHAYYGLGEMDPSGLVACKKYAPKVNQLAGERVRQEIFKILVAQNANYAIEKMLEYEVLPEILHGKARLEAFKRLNAIEATPDPVRRLAVLFSAPAAHIVDRFKLSKSMAERIFFLTETKLDVECDAKLIQAGAYIHGKKRYLDLVICKTALDPTFSSLLENTLELMQ